jgi:hypothetical protein
MGKPEEAYFFNHESCSAPRGRAARLEAMASGRPLFLLRLRPVADAGFFPIAAAFACLSRISMHALWKRAHSTEPSGDRTCGWHGAGAGAGGRHDKGPFFEVPVVPIVV